MSAPEVWTVTITFREEGDTTRADAVLHGAGFELEGWGRAKRNPADPQMPLVGEEIAAGRALGDLERHMLERAAHLIETWEGRPAYVSD